MLYFKSNLLLLSNFQGLISSRLVLMKSFKKFLNILISLTFDVYLWFEGALFLFLHLLEYGGHLDVVIPVVLG